MKKTARLTPFSPLGKLLVIGSTGLVGSKVTALASKYDFEVFPTHDRQRPISPDSSRLDITNRRATLDLVRQTDPDVVINAAALTNVDYCETHKIEATRVNVDGVKNLSLAATQTNSRLVHISTDSVFDGLRGHYRESDLRHPINHYSMTKVEAENIVSQLNDYAISRPSVVYGWHRVLGRRSGATKPMNFAMFLLDKLQKGSPLRAVEDQYSSPTLVDNLAEAILALAKGKEQGVFHTAGRSCLSRYEFAQSLVRIFGFSADLVQPVPSSNFFQIAPRPRNTCLHSEKAEKLLGIRFLTAEQGITRMKEEMAQA